MTACSAEMLGKVETNLGNSQAYLLRALQDLQSYGDQESTKKSSLHQATHEKEAAQVRTLQSLQDKIHQLEETLAGTRAKAVGDQQILKVLTAHSCMLYKCICGCVCVCVYVHVFLCMFLCVFICLSFSIHCA